MSSKSKPNGQPKRSKLRIRDRTRAGLAKVWAFIRMRSKESKLASGSSFEGPEIPSNSRNDASNFPVYSGSGHGCSSYRNFTSPPAGNATEKSSTAKHRQPAAPISLNSGSSSAASAEITEAESAGSPASSYKTPRKRNKQLMKYLEPITSKTNPSELYDQLELCGEGFGKVYMGREKRQTQGQSRSLVALKRFNLEDDDDCRFELASEIKILSSLCHPSIPRFLGAFLPNHNRLTIVTSFVKGATLVDTLEFSCMNEVQIATACRELCRCLDYLHSNLIIHGDIEGSNIMLTTEGEIQLIDFGSSVRLSDKNSKAYTGTKKLGSAPESIRGDKCSFSADIWSLGVTILQMLRERVDLSDGLFTWQDVPSEEEFLDVLMTKGTPQINATETSDELRDFASRCLCMDPCKRANVAELLNHKFLRKAAHIDCLVPQVTKFFDMHPSRVVSATAAILKQPLKKRKRTLNRAEQLIKHLGPIVSKEDPSSLYEQVEFCGEGGFGRVYMGRVKNWISGCCPGSLVALKRIELQGDKTSAQLANEVKILRSVYGFGFPKFVGAYLPNDKHLTIVTSFIEGANLSGILDFSYMSEMQIATICQNVCRGLSFLKSQNILHGDIKGSNIMISIEGEVEIVDFGASIQLAGPSWKARASMFSYPWSAPEILLGERCNGSADVWSLGMTVLEMVNQEPPYASIAPPDECLGESRTGDPEFCTSKTEKEITNFLNLLFAEGPPKLDASKASSELRDFVSRCLCIDPRKCEWAIFLSCHKFLEKAGDASCLIPLVEKYNKESGKALHC